MAGITVAGPLIRTAGGTVSLATADDEAELRALLRQSVMPGAVRLAFTREPDFFAASHVAGATDVTVIARQQGRLVGLGRCQVNTWYVSGVPRRVGYLGELRVVSGTPGAPRLIRDGYALLAEAAGRLGVDVFVTSIADDNHHARRVLGAGGRFGLPSYRPLVKLVTLALPIRRHDGAAAYRAPDPDRLTAFLDTQARRCHLTLSWDATRWGALGAHRIGPEDFIACHEGPEVVAAAAVWNQRGFRQTIVDGYDGWLQLTRPLVNAVQSLRGLPGLPAAGEVLCSGALFGAAVAHPRHWPALWHALRACATARELSWLLVTRDARDPELTVLRKLVHAQAYHTTLFEVAMGAEREAIAWDDRLARPEVALL